MLIAFFNQQMYNKHGGDCHGYQALQAVPKQLRYRPHHIPRPLPRGRRCAYLPRGAAPLGGAHYQRHKRQRHDFLCRDNGQGQLVKTRERQYGVFSGYNKAWNEFEETGSFSYYEDGRIKEDTTTNRVYHYEYERDNLVKETYANSRNVIIYHKYFSNFVEGLVNCPQYAFANSPAGLTTNDRIYEYAYDNQGNMVSCRVYKYIIALFAYRNNITSSYT